MIYFYKTMSLVWNTL